MTKKDIVCIVHPATLSAMAKIVMVNSDGIAEGAIERIIGEQDQHIAFTGFNSGSCTLTRYGSWPG